MRRIGKILSVAVLIVLLSCSACFATGLKLVDSYPSDGAKGMQPSGMAFKLHFNEDVSGEDIQKANKKCMKLVDKKGKEVPLKVLHDPSKQKELLVIVDKTLNENSDYKFTLSGAFQASGGDVLGEDTVISFKTVNLKQSTNISMLFMVVMVVGMIFFSSKAMRKQKADEEKKQREEKVNPYKVAKETGKSVQEIVAKDQKRKEKEQQKGQKNQNSNRGKNGNAVKNPKKEEHSDGKRVKGPRPISAAGSTYITGRKAAAEKAAKEAAEKKKSTHPKNSTGKSRNTKKK